MKKNKFDERQEQIRARVFGKMWITTVVLLFLCALIESGFEIQWAQTWQTYIIIAVITTSYGGIELILRGAYFWKDGSVGWVAPYAITGVSLMAIVSHFKDGDKFIESGMLTEAGGFFITSVLLLAFGVIGVVKSQQIRQQIKNNDDNAED
ncbi:MAG: hypothetical protein LBN97_06610 [Oscillospiraceae bacterium]|jgi:hypothetical protein|nr:hypothetical protein [Oscillospiraceae bacterium]